MGLIVDTNVFIQLERRGDPVDLSRWESSEHVFITAITVSELMVGVHRADTPVRRERRRAFVEAILAGISVLDFTSAVARRHAEVYADLAQRGELLGAHDMIIAATALHYDFSLLTDNTGEFARVRGLRVVAVTP